MLDEGVRGRSGFRQWRRDNLRGRVVAIGVATPCLLAAVGFALAVALPDASRSQVCGFVGTALLALGAFAQAIAASREVEDQAGGSGVDSFVLAGWTTICAGAGISFLSVLIAIGENPPL